MPYFDAEKDCRLYYEIRGSDSGRPPVVFLNGTTQTTLYWHTHFKHFQGEHRVIAYDARAQGQSDRGRVPLSLQRHAVDLRELLRHLGVHTAHLVGLSHGARLALAFADGYPECVDRLVICSLGASTSGIGQTAIHAWLHILQRADLAAMAWSALPLVFGERFLAEHHSLLDKIVAAIAARNSRESLLAQLEALLSYPPLPTPAASIGKPLLVLSGSDDLLVKPEEARRLAELCGGRHVIFPDVGHSLPAEAPGRFDDLVSEFLIEGHVTPAPETS